MAALITWGAHNVVDRAFVDVDAGTTAQPGFGPENLQERGLASSFRASLATSAGVIADCSLPFGGELDDFFASLPDGAVLSIAVLPDGKLIIGGQFTTVQGVARNHAAKLYSDGSLDLTWNPNANDTVRSVTALPDGKIIICGHFTTVGGVSRNRIARLNADGTLDTAWDPNANNTVRCAIALPDGKTIICGEFTSVGGVARNRIARLNPDGSLDSTWNPRADNTVIGATVLPDGKLVICGEFTTVNNVTRNRIARLNADGTLDTGFNPNANSYVVGITVLPDGKIIICGNFTAIGGVTRNRIARLNPDGTLDTAWNPNVVGGVVTKSLPLADGKTIIVGYFTSVGGVARNRIARLLPDGAVDTGFNLGLAGTFVEDAQPYGAHQTVIGGFFSSIGGVGRSHIARIRVDTQEVVRVAALLGLDDGIRGTIELSSRVAGESAWTHLATRDLSNGDVPNGGPNNVLMMLPYPVPASSQFRVRWQSSTSAQFGFARLWISDALVLPDGIDAGWQMGFRDSGSLDATDGQQWVQSPGVITRVLTIPLEGARKTEMHWGFADGSEAITNRMSLNALQLEAGTTGEVIAIARTQSDLWVSRTMVYGHIDQPWAIGHTAGPHWAATLTIVEER